MIICRTPFRISFFGGGTDYPGWYRQHGGAVLAATIDKYCYLTCRYLPPFFEHRIRIVYRKIETCTTLDEVSHPAVRETLRYLRIDRGVELHHDGDLPARSGMGSSSAFTVGLLHALHALRGEMATKAQLAREGIYVEQEVLKETVGSQDQVMAAHGGLRHVVFHPDGEIAANPLILPPERVAELKAHLMLFYTGIARTAADVARSYVVGIESRRRQLRIMKELVEESIDILASGMDILAFGDLLHEAWQAKRSLSPKVSNGEVDDLYERARSAGAAGGKLTGAGGGGFLLLFVPPDRQAAVTEALDGRIHVPFQFDAAGSQIIFYEPGVDYREAERARQYQTAVPFRELSDAALAREGGMNRTSRVYVAGGDTLIGAAIRDRLRADGFRSLVGTPPDEPDLTVAGQVEDFFGEARPEYVFLAAGKSGGIRLNQTQPADLMLHNLLATAHVVDCAHRHGVTKLLYLASSCSYPKSASQPLSVESLMTGPPEPTNAAYATAKLAGWQLCDAYRQQHGARFLTAIPANAFGPHDDFSPDGGHVIPALIRKAHEAKLRGEPALTVWGTGKPRREFIFARDLADACLFVMRRYEGPAPINLGGGVDLSIAEVARLVADVVGYRGRICFDSTRSDGMPLKMLDSGLLRALGWRPSVDFLTALAETYDWFLHHAPVAASGPLASS